MGVTVRVNEIEHEVAAHERSPLLWVLRGELNCASAKYGCGAEQCGACCVLVDGMPAFSCSITAGEASGRDVTTLEGLVADGRAAPVVEAMVARDAGQCGYCLPGIVVTLTALQERSAAPTADDVVRALDDHLCRCGSQPRILAAAYAALGIADD